MPSLVKKRGRMRWKGRVQVNLVIKEKLFPDDSKKSQKEAIIWENETKKMLEATEIHSVCWTVLDWATEYLRFSQEQFSKKTFDEKRSVFARLLKSVDHEMEAGSIDPAAALAYLMDQKKKRSGNAANKDRKNLATAWEYGRKYLPDFPQGPNPFLIVSKFPEKRSPRYIPPEEDFWKIYEIAEGQDSVMLLTFLHLAARRGEVFGLTWEDVDFGNSQIRLWTKKREGGDQEYDWLPMTAELRSSLMRWWQDRPVKDSSHVFVCLDVLPCNEEAYYGQPFKYRQQFMRRICKKAGVKYFGFHAIRHLTASILYHSGVSVAVIQAILRHKSPTTTNRYLRTLGLTQVKNELEQSLQKAADVISFPEKKVAK